MEKVVMWHNPRCTKSRLTHELLESKAIDFEVREYLQSPPSATELKSLLAKLGKKASEFIRSKEDLYKELGLVKSSEQELILAMIENPKLIERPVVIIGEKAAIGRPPENVLEIL